MRAYECPNCRSHDIVSVEQEVHYYEIYPNLDGEKEYTSYSDCIDGTIEFILCRDCGSDFHENQLPDMVVNMEEEE